MAVRVQKIRKSMEKTWRRQDILMLRVKCINPNCTAPEGKFTWDERAHVNRYGGVAQPDEPEALSFLVDCPYCGIENKVWLKKVKRDESVTRRLK